ncbi:hypothetical protein H6F66_18390 [Trichocoleus sp. FACHB-6]|uniref:hypothetical protein n=1 Tax=Trichocoleus sp. FACHB-832 TaxID=2692875 RepID=UPI001685D6F6|nr:hypothetical protein [Trichocoleus sp. FACHB-832]MBD1907168.1 hypothetical protein [Trichocoleus sp. FACHB-832]MBD2064211.1 hypothetical protein [Trichocoleus sp. FACHB-6]
MDSIFLLNSNLCTIHPNLLRLKPLEMQLHTCVRESLIARFSIYQVLLWWRLNTTDINIKGVKVKYCLKYFEIQCHAI